MKIGRLSNITGLSKDTIRYYEDIGLIPEPDRRPSGYRKYGDKYIERLLFIKEIKKLGFTLSEIDTLLNMKFSDGTTTGQVKQFFEEKIQEVEQKIAKLTAVQSALKEVSSRCDGGNKAVDKCAILNFIDMKIFNNKT